MSSKKRNYKDAVDALNSLQSNAATLEALRISGGRMSAFAIPEMIEYLERMGYKSEDLNRLNVIHVTGTKGKGSTSAFCDSILRKTMPNWKVGLYTSPHLVAVRERIRVNGEPMSEEDFAKYFFEVWDRLKGNEKRKDPSTAVMPAYFRFMTLLAYHYFISTKVDATILEVGVGGYYDSTNIVPKPVVTGVTSLGLDHTAVLGTTLREIAWQKGGIYKSGVPALTVEQPEEAMEMLKQQAKTLKSSSFTVVPEMAELQTIKLGLAGSHQRQNAALAVHLSHQFLLARKLDMPSDFLPSLYPAPIPQSYLLGLESTRWPGRCQEVQDPNHHQTHWFLDGAHTIESLSSCGAWFFQPSTGLKPISTLKRNRILVFNCTNGRNGKKLLSVLLEKFKQVPAEHRDGHSSEGFFDHVVFCTNITYIDGNSKADLANNTVDHVAVSELKTQQQLADAWRSLVPSYPKDHVHIVPSVQAAVEVVRSQAGEDCYTCVLVAGSLHLVGGVIEVADLGSTALTM